MSLFSMEGPQQGSDGPFVSLSYANGHPCPVRIAVGVTVEDAKLQIENDLQVQAEAMVISEGQRRCEDTEILRGGQKLTLIIGWEQALQDLHLSDAEDELYRRRANALLFLARQMPALDTDVTVRTTPGSSPASAISTISGCIGPSSLEEDANKFNDGDGRMILGITVLMGHDDPMVRRRAIRVLAERCMPGDELVFRALAWRLTSPKPEMKGTVLECLQALANWKDERVLRLVCRFLDDQDPAIRVLAVKTIPKFMPYADSKAWDHAIHVVAAVCKDPSLTARVAAIETIAEMSTSDNPRVLEDISSALTDPYAMVRSAAATAIAIMLGKKDRCSFGLVRDLCDFGDESILHFCQQALKVAVKPCGYGDAVDLVSTWLKHTAYEKRKAAVHLLGFLADRGDWKVIQLLARRLRDQHHDVRISAAKVLADIVEKGDFRSLTVLARAIADPNTFVRSQVAMAMVTVANPYDSRVLDLLQELLRTNNEPKLLAQTLEVIGETSVQGDRRAMAAVSEYLDDDRDIVSRAAMKSMAMICQNGVVSAFQAFMCLQKDTTESCNLMTQTRADGLPTRAPSQGKTTLQKELMALGEEGLGTRDAEYVTSGLSHRSSASRMRGRDGCESTSSSTTASSNQARYRLNEMVTSAHGSSETEAGVEKEWCMWDVTPQFSLNFFW